MSAQILQFDSTTASSGTGLHFSVVQATDLHVSGQVIDPNGFANKKVHRIFQQRYQKVSLFAMEQTYTEITTLTLGNQGTIELNLLGDILYNTSLVCVFPDYSVSQNVTDSNFSGDTTRNTVRKFGYCTNLGACITSKLNLLIETVVADQQKTNQTIIINNLTRAKDQRDYFNQLQGHSLERAKLETSKSGFKVMVPLKFFYADDAKKSLQWLRGGCPTVKIQTEFRKAKDLVCCTRNIVDYDFDTNLKPTKLGYVCQEIFLSEQERIIQMKVPATLLMEQNQIFESAFGNGQGIQPSQFNYPTKWMSFAIQKLKYQQKLPFLAYRPNIDGVDQLDDLLKEATHRFVLKFAAYKALITSTSVSTFSSTTSAITSLGLPSTLQPTSANAAYIGLSFNEDTSTGLIKSMFQSSIATEQNTTSWSIDTIFNRIQPYAFTIDSVQRFIGEQNILLQGGYLTLEEASRSVDAEYKTHLPSTVNFLAQTQSTDAILKFLFSLYSSGAVTGTYGSTGQFTASIESSQTGQNIFSPILKDLRYNQGLDVFDICVTQWDNYGKYIDGSGDLIQTTELFVGNQQRFKVSGFYTQAVHQMNYFPGKTPKGVHVYSFALKPCEISPSGMFNLTRNIVKFNISADCDTTDLLFINTVSYNIMDLRANQTQVLYSMSYN